MAQRQIWHQAKTQGNVGGGSVGGGKVGGEDCRATFSAVKKVKAVKR